MNAKIGVQMVAVAMLILWSAVAPFAGAQAVMDRSFRVDIPEQALGESLKALADQGDFQIVFAVDVVKDHVAPRVAGLMGATQALTALLAGTGLEYVYAGDAIVVRAQKAESAKPASSAMQSQATGSNERIERRGWLSWTHLAQAQTEQSDSSAQSASTEDKTAPVLEEIVVTAEKRSETLQSVPIAITAISGEMIAQRGPVNLEDLQRLAPSLQIGQKLPDGNQRIAMRGVGATAGEGTVSIIHDGIPVAGNVIDFDIFDTERVEVLRGPQGTVSGRNATAGAISVISNRPTETPEGQVKFTLGNYDRMEAEGVLSGPIAGDRLLGRLAARVVRSGGWLTNELDHQELGTTDKVNFRTSLLGKLNDALQATFIWERDENRSELPPHFLDGRARPEQPSFDEVHGLTPFDWEDKGPIRRDLTSDTDFQRDQVTLRVDWELSPTAHLAATTGYIRRSGEYITDSDGTEFRIVGWSDTQRRYGPISQASQEITLTADLTDRLDVIFGGLYLQGNFKGDVVLGLPFLGVPDGAIRAVRDDDLTSWAGYTQWRYKLTDKIRLTGGARYSHDDGKVRRGAPLVAASSSWDAWTPRFAIDFIPTNDLTVYASVAKGYKAGGFNSPTQSFEPEYVWNYEAGVKANVFDERLSVRAAAFYMEYQDLQLSIQTLEDLGEGNVTFRTQNANSATIKGLELELDAQISDRFRLSGGGTWLPTADFDDLQSVDNLYPELGTPGPSGVNVRDLTGNRIPRAPKFQANVSGEYTQPISNNWQGVLTASYAWQDQVFFDFYNHPLFAQEAYGVLNLSAAIETHDGNWRLTGFVHNATDKFYRTEDVYAAFGPTSISLVYPGEPRMYGISFAHRF